MIEAPQNKARLMNDLVPSEFYLSQNYPNPFKEKTTIKYCIPFKTKVRITVFNSEGEMIAKLIDEEKDVGTHKVEFKPLESNMQLRNEILLYRLESGNYSRDKQMILEK